jgi:hypothetical protein
MVMVASSCMLRNLSSRWALYVTVVLAMLSTCVDSKSCFDAENPPSCFQETIYPSYSTSYAQEVCWKLEQDYLYNIEFFLDEHTDAMKDLSDNSDLCDDAKQYYHLCFWCAQNVSDDFCFFETCKEPEVVDETVDMVATCKELDKVIGGRQLPATIDLCYRGEQASYYACREQVRDNCVRV